MTGNMTASPLTVHAIHSPESNVHAIFPGLFQMFPSSDHSAFSFNFVVADELTNIATGITPNIPPTTQSYDKHT